MRLSLFRLLLLSFFILPLNSKAVTISYDSLMSTGLPLVHIQTVNNEEPTCDYVWHPDGYAGASITNQTKVPGRLLVYRKKKLVYDSDEYENEKNGCTVRLRGNTSAWSVKKPYKIKLQIKADLFLRGTEFEDKDWLLIKPGGHMEYKPMYDLSLNCLVGFKLSELVGMQWTPTWEHVNLMINDDYKGVYILCESVKRNAKCRINVDSKTGFIVERDPYWWNEDYYIETPWTDYFRYTFKYPDEDDLNEQIMENVRNAMMDVEESIENGTYPSFIDVESFVKWHLCHEILGTGDDSGANLFLSKYDDSILSKLLIPVLWDFDSAFEISGWFADHRNPFFPFFSNNDIFVRSYIRNWRDMKNKVLQLYDILNEYKRSEEAKNLDKSRYLEIQRYGETSFVGVDDNISFITGWLDTRIKWLDNAICELEKNIDTGMSKTYNTSIHNVFYGINGYRYNKGTLPKIRIIGNRKIIVN